MQGFWIFNWLTATWLWRWLPHRLSKRQSLKTVLLRTPITQMIFFDQGMLLLLGSNHFLIISLSCFSSFFWTDVSVVNAVTGLLWNTGRFKSFSNKSKCSFTTYHAILCSPCSWLGEGKVVLDWTKFVRVWFSTLLLLLLLLLGIGGNSGVFSLGSSLSESKSKSWGTLSK